MSDHLVRRGGIWWVRLVVPARLREAAGRREFTKSTRTHELHVAKLVASVMLAEWRKQLMKLESVAMSDAVLKLLEAAPALEIGGTISLDRASELGVARTDLLRLAAAGRIVLHCRLGVERGVLVNVDDLEVDSATGEREIPPIALMPDTAVTTAQFGVLPLAESNVIAHALVAEPCDAFRVLTLRVPGHAKQVFVPERALEVQVGQLEVSARAVQKIRDQLVAKLSPAEVERAFDRRAVAAPAGIAAAGKRSAALFSEAVEAYCTDKSGLPNDLTSEAEQRQRRAAMLQFVEFMGDRRLAEIDADVLRTYRDGPLSRYPANANKLPKSVRRSRMSDTIKAIADSGIDWPIMTEAMRQERMRWLARLFGWLHRKQWIASDPSTPLKGETGQTKAQRMEKHHTDDDEDETGREPFAPHELALIFSQSWFASGTGADIKRPRIWYPFEYWLPLLGLFAGCRIKEASQLHLSDVRQADGVWFLDINQTTRDKKLKNPDQSRRRIPLHPRLVELGFLVYCERLKTEGFRRVFPDLSWVKTDARYAKESGRKMSQMLRDIGMPRNGMKVFHCLRHNMNNALMRVPMSALPYADEILRQYIRFVVMGHQVGEDVNTQHYTSTPMAERFALVAEVKYDLPPIAPLDIEFAIRQIRTALDNKKGDRRGREDMGPLNPAAT